MNGRPADDHHRPPGPRDGQHLMTPGPSGPAAREIIVFGSLNQDIRLAAGRIARPGETVGGAELTTRWGGKGANQAVAAARLGGRVGLVSAVGADATGKAALAALDADGVDRRDVAEVSGTPTGTAIVIVADDGDNAITVAPGANATVTADQLTPVLDRLPPGVLVACFELPLEQVREAAGRAARAGWEVIVNPAPAAAPLAGEWPKGLLVTPNAHELRALTGIADVEQAARWLAGELDATVVATLGADGAIVVTPDRQRAERVPAPRVTPRDTTGAGDAFNGTLAWCRAQGSDLVEAVRIAVAAASASTEHEGAREGMPTYRQLAARVPLGGDPTTGGPTDAA
jgi:ribokinase